MRFLPFVFFPFVFTACGSASNDDDVDSGTDVDTDIDIDTDTDSSGGTNCPWEVDSLVPADGSTAVWLSPTYDDLTVTLDVDAVQDVRVFTSAGVAVPGNVARSGTSGTWTPQGNTLAATTDYRIEVESGGCSAQVGTFSTVHTTAVSFDTTAVYAFDFDAVRGQGALLMSTLGSSFGMGLWTPAADEWEFVPMDGASQDTCVPTTGVLGSYDAPELLMYRVTAPVGEPDLGLLLVEMDILALPAADGRSFSSVRMRGHIDVTASSGAGFDLCDTAFGLECVPCPDDSSYSCATIDVYNITASALNISPIDVDEVCEVVE